MKSLKIVLVLICISMKLYSQKKYTINFQTKAMTVSTTTNSTAEIEIENFNPYLYKVTITSRDSILDESLNVPPLWDYLSSIDNIQKLLESVKNATSSNSSTVTLEKSNNTIGPFEIAETNTATVGSATISPTDKAATITSLTVLSGSLKTIENSFVTNVYAKIHNYMYDLGALKSLTKMDYVDLEMMKSIMTRSTTALSTFTNINAQNLAIKTQIYDLVNNFEVFALTNNSRIERSSIDTYFKGLWDRCVALEDLSNTIDTMFSAEKYTNLYSTIINLTRNNFVYHSFPIEVSDDITKINIRVEPRDEAKSLLGHSYSTQLILQDRKKYNIGFSSGFYYSGLYNRKYYSDLNVSSGDSIYRAVSQNPDIGEIGINALFNIYYQPCKTFGIGGNAGVGIVIDQKVLPRLFAGLSLSFGDKNKFVLSGGPTVGKVDMLSEEYKGDNKHPIKDFTVSRYKFSGFVSFGYTLFSSKSKN